MSGESRGNAGSVQANIVLWCDGTWGGKWFLLLLAVLIKQSDLQHQQTLWNDSVHFDWSNFNLSCFWLFFHHLLSLGYTHTWRWGGWRLLWSCDHVVVTMLDVTRSDVITILMWSWVDLDVFMILVLIIIGLNWWSSLHLACHMIASPRLGWWLICVMMVLAPPDISFEVCVHTLLVYVMLCTNQASRWPSTNPLDSQTSWMVWWSFSSFDTSHCGSNARPVSDAVCTRTPCICDASKRSSLVVCATVSCGVLIGRFLFCFFDVIALSNNTTENASLVIGSRATHHAPHHITSHVSHLRTRLLIIIPVIVCGAPLSLSPPLTTMHSWHGVRLTQWRGLPSG